MYVETSRDSLVRLKTPELNSVAQFSKNNVAQVTQSDGEILISNFDHITEKQ